MSLIVPKAVKDKTSDLAAMYGGDVEYKGKYEGRDVYMFRFPDDTETGFPFVYLYDDDNEDVTELTGFESLKLLRVLRKINQ